MNSKACLLVDKNFIILEFNQSFKEFFRSYQKVIEQENLSDFFSKFKVFSDSKIETITQGELKRGKSLNQTKRTNYFNILEAKHDTSFFKSDDL